MLPSVLCGPIVGHCTPTTGRLWIELDAKSVSLSLKLKKSDGGNEEDVPPFTLSRQDEREQFGGSVRCSQFWPVQQFQIVIVSLSFADPLASFSYQFETQGASWTSVNLSSWTGESFSFALASCRYPNTRGLWGWVESALRYTWLGGYYEHFTGFNSEVQQHLSKKAEIDFQIFGGDQIYGDWSSDKINSYVASAAGALSGSVMRAWELEDYRTLYHDAFAQREHMKACLSKRPSYFGLDDHEVYNNWALDDDKSHHKYIANGLSAYWLFQHGNVADQSSLRPELFDSKEVATQLAAGNLPSLHHAFSRGNHRFFFMDVRTERKNKEHLMVSPEQIRRLRAFLQEKIQGIHFIVSSVSFFPISGPPPPHEGNVDAWEGYLGQQQAVLFAIEHTGARVVFLSGDLHYGGTWTATNKVTKQKIHQVISSPLAWPRKLRELTDKGTEFEYLERYLSHAKLSSAFSDEWAIETHHVVSSLSTYAVIKVAGNDSLDVVHYEYDDNAGGMVNPPREVKNLTFPMRASL